MLSRATSSGLSTWLTTIAAPHWTVVFFLLTAAMSLLVSPEGASATLLMAAPFTLLILNLGAAIATLPRFRRDLPLLLFHLTLLLLVALFVVARLTYFQGTTTLTRGDTFAGDLLTDERGPWHGNGLSTIRFTNLGFKETFSAQGEYESTLNQIRWSDAGGQWQQQLIGDDYPLVIGHYRIYTSSYRGFAPLFRWTSATGQATQGRVQLSATIGTEMAPANSWSLPDGTEIWAMLEIPPSTKDEQPLSVTNLGAASLSHTLVLRINDQRHELQPGNSLTLPSGQLTYLALDSWMGYRIIYDPVQPWLIATVIVSVLSLARFYLRQLRAKGTWDSD